MISIIVALAGLGIGIFLGYHMDLFQSWNETINRQKNEVKK